MHEKGGHKWKHGRNEAPFLKYEWIINQPWNYREDSLAWKVL